MRWRFVPLTGFQRLTGEELKTSPIRFFDDDLFIQAQQGPLSWRMILILGESSDEQIKLTVNWPTDRKEIYAGILTIRTATPQAGSSCERINYDPLAMADGTAPTNGLVVLFRSPSYASSFAKRLTCK